MLTEGTAACSIYSLKPTADNKTEAKKRLFDAGLVPVTFVGNDPNLVAAMGSESIELMPWKYKVCPPSPGISDCKRKLENIICNGDSDSGTSSQEQDFAIVPSRGAILDMLKLLLLPDQAGDLTEKVFMTEHQVYGIIQEYVHNHDHIRPDKVNYWMSMDGTWGEITRKSINGTRRRGRWLHLVKKEFRDFQLTDVSHVNKFRNMVKATNHDYLTIGYVRKSKSNLNLQSRRLLLELMAKKLKTKMLCDKVYASFSSSTSEPIVDRDGESKHTLIGVDGDTQDMISSMTLTTKKVRLVIIDYAGLSTNPDDIISFLKLVKRVKEIAVDHGHNVELLSRYNLLKSHDVINKFRCRVAPIRRSS